MTVFVPLRRVSQVTQNNDILYSKCQDLEQTMKRELLSCSYRRFSEKYSHTLWVTITQDIPTYLCHIQHSLGLSRTSLGYGETLRSRELIYGPKFHASRFPVKNSANRLIHLLWNIWKKSFIAPKQTRYMFTSEEGTIRISTNISSTFSCRTWSG